MMTFNNDNIFTGYLKQLLSTFNLPKVRVYNKEQANYNHIKKHNELVSFQSSQQIKKQKLIDSYEETIKKLEEEKTNHNISEAEYLIILDSIEKNKSDLLLKIENNLKNIEKNINNVKKELNIISTSIHNKVPSIEESWELNKYPEILNYTLYIKDNAFQFYYNGNWHDTHLNFDYDNKHFNNVHKNNNYIYRKQYEYNRKYNNLTKNLVIKNNIYDSYTHEYLGDYLRFQRDYNDLNLMPLYNCFSNRLCSVLNTKIKINDEYIAEFNTLDKRYKIYMLPVKFFKNYTIALSSDYRVEAFCGSFDQYLNDGTQKNAENELLTKLINNSYFCFNSMQFDKPELYTKLNEFIGSLTDDELSEISLFEDTLKLFIKVPANIKSSIVVLEGNYVDYTKSFLAYDTNENKNIRKTNHIATNLEEQADEKIDFLVDKLITPLQLLQNNTGTSYPFADRLIEYLVGNTISHMDDIADNSTRVNVASKLAVTGLGVKVLDDISVNHFWNKTNRIVFYNFINEKYNNALVNHDILGYVDKDIESLFSFKTKDKTTTLSQIDIYDDPIIRKVVDMYEQ